MEVLLLYILYGDDYFSIKEALVEIKERLGGEELIATNTTILSGQDINPQQLYATCDTIPFLAPSRLVIVEDLLSRFEKKEKGKRQTKSDSSEWKSLEEYVKRMPESTTLVLIDGKLSRTNPLLISLSQYGQVQEFKPLYGDYLKRWISNRVKKADSNISPPAIHLLAELVGSNLWMMSNEIDKLCTYTQGRRIEEDDVKLLTADAREADIFAMVDAVLNRNSVIATRLLHSLEKDGAAPPYLLFMITRQFRMVLQSKDLVHQRRSILEIGKALGIYSDFTLRKTIDQAKNHSMGQLHYIYRKLLDTDLSIKTGRLKGDKGELALDLLISELCSIPK